jgi:hypothetical protein
MMEGEKNKRGGEVEQIRYFESEKKGRRKEGRRRRSTMRV